LLEHDIKELNKMVDRLNVKIFIVTEAFDEFPISILHNSVKYAFEKQHGFMNQVKHTLELAFEEFDLSDRDKLTNFVNRTLEKRIVFSTCFLHALLTERSYLG